MSQCVPQQAIDFLMQAEGLHDGNKRTPMLEPARDPIGIWTVGYGYALFEGGRPVRDRERAMAIYAERWPAGLTLADANVLLREVAQDVCDRVLRLLPGVAPADHELSALVSLAYNIGVGEVGGAADFADSTVRRRLLAGDRLGAADAFGMWVKAGGRVLDGLVLRRAAERALFLGRDLPAEMPVNPVMALQQALNRAGADPRLIEDGVCGPVTRAAVAQFQRSRGLAPDGVSGPATRAALGLA